MKTWLLVGMLAMLAGCINITTTLQPVDQTVRPTYEGSDCVPIIFSIGIGTNTIERAQANGKDRAAYQAAIDRKHQAAYAQRGTVREVPLVPITKVHRVQFTDYGFLGFGARCVEVTGEP